MILYNMFSGYININQNRCYIKSQNCWKVIVRLRIVMDRLCYCPISSMTAIVTKIEQNKYFHPVLLSILLWSSFKIKVQYHVTYFKSRKSNFNIIEDNNIKEFFRKYKMYSLVLTTNN